MGRSAKIQWCTSQTVSSTVRVTRLSRRSLTEVPTAKASGMLPCAGTSAASSVSS